MAINLNNLEPIKASTDLSSYTAFIYGTPKIGKTTFVHNLYGDRVLFLATEKRHKVLVGAYVQDISSWPEFLTSISQLRSPKMKERFDVIAIDTVENLYSMLESYILAKYNKTEFGQVEWGKDWVDLKNDWKNGLQMIEKIGYSPVFISHAIQKTERIPVSGILQEQVNETMSLVKDKKTDEEYYEFLKYVPDLKDKVMAPINKMVDNILFMNVTTDESLKEHRVIYLRESLQWQAGSTFNDIKPVIPLSSTNYKEAVQEAIGKIDPNLTKDEKEETSLESEKIDFDELMKEARGLAIKFHEDGRMDEVNRIVEEVFGPGNKLVDANKHQVQPLLVAVERMKELS
ncbi:ATP-binding protein [Staphylococcus equorum]|uniref:ATP-binding protein n=1 Tax=Staphylococcus equorum TaxID=246432 RepID=A0A9X4LCS8_9STAP|nr:ATP-binding protein [Staphylococcus equorum]MDG0860394.1 ATP-binding protein [Staphylococcus equorum]